MRFVLSMLSVVDVFQERALIDLCTSVAYIWHLESGHTDLFKEVRAVF